MTEAESKAVHEMIGAYNALALAVELNTSLMGYSVATRLDSSLKASRERFVSAVNTLRGDEPP